MEAVLIDIVCRHENCLREFKGRTYQKFCSKKCQDGDYYIRIKQRRIKSRKEVTCNHCGTVFFTNRLNAKRCSKICRQAYIRDYSLNRNKISKEKRLKEGKELTCIVCSKIFKSGHVKKTCSKVCAKESQKYFYRQKERDKNKAEGVKFWDSVNYVQKIWPLTTNKRVKVSNFKWPPSKIETEKAVAEFIKGGGEIRNYKEEIATDLITDNPFCKVEVIQEDAESELFGTVKAS